MGPGFAERGNRYNILDIDGQLAKYGDFFLSSTDHMKSMHI